MVGIQFVGVFLPLFSYHDHVWMMLCGQTLVCCNGSNFSIFAVLHDVNVDPVRHASPVSKYALFS